MVLVNTSLNATLGPNIQAGVGRQLLGVGGTTPPPRPYRPTDRVFAPPPAITNNAPAPTGQGGSSGQSFGISTTDLSPHFDVTGFASSTSEPTSVVSVASVAPARTAPNLAAWLLTLAVLVMVLR